MDKKVKILGVPLDLGTKKLGVDMGPNSIRYTKIAKAFGYNKIKFEDGGDIFIDKASKPCPLNEKYIRKVISEVSETLAQSVYNYLDEGFFPVVLGGDHSTSIGVIAGIAKKVENMGLLWFDTHPDINTPQTSPSGNIHGMTVAISLGYGHQELVDCAGFSPKIKPENICMVGVNDIDSGERKMIEELGIKVFSLMDIERYGIFTVIDEAVKIVTKNTDHVHLSLDVDVLESQIAPGTGISSRGGLNYREIIYAMKYLGQEKIINSMDIIEVNPILDVKNRTAELAVELLIAALGGSFGDYERNYLAEQNRL